MHDSHPWVALGVQLQAEPQLALNAVGRLGAAADVEGGWSPSPGGGVVLAAKEVIGAMTGEERREGVGLLPRMAPQL